MSWDNRDEERVNIISTQNEEITNYESTIINIDEDNTASTSNEANEKWKVRKNALKQLPLNLVIVGVLLGASESISIFLENLEVEPLKKQTMLDYIKKGYTLGMGSSAVELATDFTAFKYVDKVIKNCREIAFGKPVLSLEDTILEKINEKFSTLKTLMNHTIEESNKELKEELEKQYEAKFEQWKTKFENEHNSLKATVVKHASSSNNPQSSLNPPLSDLESKTFLSDNCEQTDVIDEQFSITF